MSRQPTEEAGSETQGDVVETSAVFGVIWDSRGVAEDEETASDANDVPVDCITLISMFFPEFFRSGDV